MGLLNDSTQNLHETEARKHDNMDQDHGQDLCEFNIYKDIKSSPKKYYCKRFFK